MAKKPTLTDDPMGDDAMDGGRFEAPLARAGAVDPGATRPADRAAPGRDASGHARPRTRIQGYGGSAASEAPQDGAPPVGWLVVVQGPGRGAALPLIAGMNGIGRGEGVQIQLDFGDDAISRDAHAYVTYDASTRRFFVSHGGKTNLVRLNAAPVLAVEALAHGDTLNLGATSLRFVALCGDDFDWAEP